LEGIAKTYRFSKAEKLCSEKKISQLFKNGNTIKAGCLRIIYMIEEENKDCPIQLLISVPKKQFRLAVTRNHIKRLIREAYRLNKTVLLNTLTLQKYSLQLAIIFIGTKDEHYDAINKSLVKGISKLTNRMNNIKQRNN